VKSRRRPFEHRWRDAMKQSHVHDSRQVMGRDLYASMIRFGERSSTVDATRKTGWNDEPKGDGEDRKTTGTPAGVT
jgi:hypothetical protein